MIQRQALLLGTIVLLGYQTASGATSSPSRTYKFGVAHGLMQQPSSQYYLAVHGAYGDFGLENQNIFIRALYLERPVFSAGGFYEQEFGGFGFIGTKVTNPDRAYGLKALMGGGTMSGFIKAKNSLDLETRRYRMNGFALGLEAFAAWKFIELALNHQSFIGVTSREEVKSYVAWPFNFFVFKIGFLI